MLAFVYSQSKKENAKTISLFDITLCMSSRDVVVSAAWLQTENERKKEKLK